MNKNTLFRFVTASNPQLITQDEKSIGFLEHPNLGNSNFFSLIANITDLEDIILALNTAADNYTGYNSYNEPKALNQDLHKFALWLAKNKNKLTKPEIATAISGVINLTSIQSDELWENLFYQAITNKSKLISETIRLMLITNKFITEFNNLAATPVIFNDEESAKFKRMANGSVVIPNKIAKRANPKPLLSRIKSARNEQIILKKQENDIAKIKTVQLNNIKSQINEIYETYNHVINLEKQVHDATIISPLINSIESQNVAYVANKGTGKISIRPIDIPKFVPSVVFNQNYVQGKVSDKASKYVTNYYDKSIDDISPLNKAIDEQIGNYSKSFFNSLKGLKQKKAIFNGTTIDLKAEPQSNSCAVRFEPIAESTKKYTVFVTQYFSNVAKKAETVSLTITFPNNPGVSHSATALKPTQINNGYVTFELFDEVEILDENEILEIALELETASGDTHTFLVDGVLPQMQARTPIVLYPNNLSSDPVSNLYPGISLYGVSRIGTAIYRRVEQELCGYVKGEVAHIENIMAREYKERSTRKLTRSQITTTEKEESEREFISDTSSTDRFEMNSEAQTVVNEENSKDHGNAMSFGGSAQYTNPTVQAEVHFDANNFANFASSSSTSESNNQAVNIGKEITQKIVDKIVSKVSNTRTSIMLKEYEENNKHGFDNRDGDTHVTGIFRWVDKIYTNKIVNYGFRTMYEFALPEPSLNFKDSIRNIASIPSGIVLLEEPIHPAELGMEEPYMLTKENYANIAGEYNAEIEEFPIDKLQIAKAYSSESGSEENSRIMAKAYNDFFIPEGYTCSKVKWGGGLMNSAGDAGNPSGEIQIANRPYVLEGFYTGGELALWGVAVEGALPVSIRTRWAGGFNFNVIAFCEVKESFITQWKLDSYNKIMEAYQAKVDEYNAERKEQDQPGIVDLSINPAYSRATERREMKRMAIELITRPFGITTAKENYEDPNENNLSKIDISEQFANHASHVKFLEQAIEWDLMSYNFYPYYWADESKWHELMNTSNNSDPLFQSFLQAGMARMVVPARKEFEQALNFYLDTGIIWNGQDFALEHDDDLYLSIEEELMQPESEIEETWTSQIPTSLTMLQAQAAALIDEGLPSTCDDAEELGQGNSMLGTPR